MPSQTFFENKNMKWHWNSKVTGGESVLIEKQSLPV